MKTLFILTLTLACACASAQTPASNPMPDGSRDMYVGLGVIAGPEYQGGQARRSTALPMLQFEWSNGVFVSGLSAGMHLANRPTLEYGPLLSIHPGREHTGTRAQIGGVTDPVIGFAALPKPPVANGLDGMNDVKARLQAGAFTNYYLNPKLRLTNSLLYGAGNDRDGLAWNLGLQYIAVGIAAHHRVSLSAGMNLVNRSHNASFFGVTANEALSSGHPAYAPEGGLRDLYVGAGWNWALSPAWLLASAVRVTQLQGDAMRSPLVQRSTNTAVSTGLAYRF